MRTSRLMREYAEVMRCPVANITIAPLNEENLEEWHGNIKGAEDSDFEDIVVHFVVTFPTGYPSMPPRIEMCSYIPHLNIQRRNMRWEVCLDMLETPPIGSMTVAYQYWSSAFSVRSILIQLTSFILAKGQPTEVSSGNISRTVTESSSYECVACGHSRMHPTPPFPSDLEVSAAPVAFPSVEVSGEAAQKLQARILARRIQQQKSSLELLKEKDDTQKVKAPTSDSSASTVSTGSEKQSVPESALEPQWVTVNSRRAFNKVKSVKLSFTTDDGEQSNPYNMLEAAESELVKYSCSSCQRKLKQKYFSRSQLSKSEGRRCSECLKAVVNLSSHKGVSPPVNKNFARRQKRRLAKQLLAQSTKPEEPTTEISSSNSDIPSDLSIVDEDVVVDTDEEWKSRWRCEELAGATDQNMGLLRTLSRDTSLAVISYLSVADVLALGIACRGTASMTDDWVVWRTLFKTRYPRSSLSPSGPTYSWRTAYMLEANCLAQDLTCFHSFSTKSEAVLGFPIIYTTNPKTGCLDYVTSTFDILSLESYKTQGVRRTVWGEKFSSFLPIYIDEEHFTRALKPLLSTCRKIVTEGTLNTRPHRQQQQRRHESHRYLKQDKADNIEPAWTPHSDPEMALFLLTKMMNTQVVLLMDKGIAVSDVTLTGYCQLHRLLLALVDSFPQLRIIVRRRLDDFARRPDKRVKQYTPSLGELLTLLSVSDTYSWSSIAMAYIKESFDRSVLWACSRDPSLATVIHGDESRLDKYFAVQKVAMRLTLFHAVFLTLLVRGGGSRNKLDDCIDRYDTFQGRPPLYIRRKWQNAVESILNLESWPQFFAISGIPLPSKPQLLSVLESAVKNSLKKGYHSRDTVFQNVMRSGVSRILLKGETYSAAPNLRRIRMIEKWRFDGHTIFLDASCLIFDFHGKNLGKVDYCHTSWDNGNGSGLNRSAPVVHSGDVVDSDTGIGQHTIDIDFKKLPSIVGSLFFTVSAWTTSLKEISQPSAHLHDVESDTEMCRYQLEEQNTGDKTAVIMCKLQRSSVGSRWELTSIGHICYGRAGTYGPIYTEIEKFL